jgi:hypothetical protein
MKSIKVFWFVVFLLKNKNSYSIYNDIDDSCSLVLTYNLDLDDEMLKIITQNINPFFSVVIDFYLLISRGDKKFTMIIK